MTTGPSNDRSNFDGLTRMAGRWATTGVVVGDPELPVRGFDTYEVLAGGFFLVHHVDVTVGDQAVRAIEIIGEPDEGGQFLARSYDNAGNYEVMRVSVDDDGAIRFFGGPDIAPAAQRAANPPAHVRSTLTVAPDGESMAAVWEQSPDGSRWERWMDITFARIVEPA